MIDEELLEEKIEKSGKSYTYLANVMGISVQAFRLKRKGKMEFKLSEIQKLCPEIGINTPEEVQKIFNLV